MERTHFRVKVLFLNERTQIDKIDINPNNLNLSICHIP